MKHVVFLHGLGGEPESFKTRFLREGGYRVTAPRLPDLDFAAAVAVADHTVAAAAPDVIIGYSRGGAVAMMLADRTTPRLLIAPALHWVEDHRGFEGPLVILHSATDDGLPLDELRAHLVRCGFSTADLRIVGDDHTMIDPPALTALTAALGQLARNGWLNGQSE